MILDYSQPGTPRPKFAGILRTFWSHRARLEFSQGGTAGQAIGILIVISLISAVLTVTHGWLYKILQRVVQSPGNAFWWVADQISHAGQVIGGRAIILVPLYFGALLLAAMILAYFWAWRVKSLRVWRHCFAAVSASAVPMLWFFLLLQFEGFAPHYSRNTMWKGQWNPVINSVRFGSLMIGVILLAVWIVDISRLCHSVRFKESRQGPS